MIRIDKKEGLALLFCAALIAAVFMTGVLDKCQTWGTMEWSYLHFMEQDPEHPHYGIQNTGPEFNLPKGTYRLKFCIETDGSGTVRLASTNDAPIEPAAFPFSRDQYEQVVQFEIGESAKQVDIQVDFESGTYYEMGETRLYTPFYKDNAFTFAFVLLGCWALAVLWRHRLLSGERGVLLMLMAVAVLFASAPALKENLSVFHDTRYHSARMRNLADGLLSGQFPVRLGGFSYNGYGAITSVFYPDLFLYPFAAMLIAGASIQYVMNVILIACNLLACFTLFACGRRIWRSERAGAFAAILYVLSVYRVTDVCVRFALGEMLAMGFLPLFLCGLWETVWGDARAWYKLGIGAACIFLSHMISTFLCVLLAFAVVIPAARRVLKEGRWRALLKAVLLALALSAYHIGPLLSYLGQGIGADASLFTTTMAGTAVAPAQLLLKGTGNLSKLPTDGTLSFMPLEIGLPLLTGVALAAGSALESGRAEWDGDTRVSLLFIAVGAWFALMSTTLFPWSYVSVVTKLFDRIQFAYRYLMFPALLFSLVGGRAFARLCTAQNRTLVSAVVLCAAVSAVLPTLTEQTRHYEFYEFGRDVSPDIKQFTEYCLPEADMNETRYRAVETQGEITLRDAVKRGASFTATAEAAGDASVTLPLFAFDGYEARLGGERLSCGKTETGKLVVYIPKGSSGTLKVFFAGKRIWRLGDALTLLTLICLCAWRMNLHRRYQTNA